MDSYSWQNKALAVGLSALAGFVDAIGFMASGGFFVSFMSGNSTRLGVGIPDLSSTVLVASALIGVFVVGVAAGGVLGHVARLRARPVILLLIASVLAAAALAEHGHHLWAALPLLAFAMGAENAVFVRDGETRVGVTYMTGALVRIGHALAGFATGQRRSGWIPYAVLWLGLVAGAVGGAIAYSELRAGGIWIASGAAALLALCAFRIAD